nr:TrkH family potassium uptake protein [Mammaliicoccus sp. Marseille-Q6498]
MKTFIKLISFYLGLFLSTTLIGSILLYLPVTGRRAISFVDAFFITTSAFTVTGLSTVDIPTQFNTLGYTIILLLIQIGGLGIVAVTLFSLILFNKKISLSNRELLMISWNYEEFGGVIKILKKLFIYTALVEFVGFVLLSIKFVPMYGVEKGMFTSLFTAVSAFNNAGLALFSDNLMQFTGDFYVNIVVSLLIILGGIGPLVVYDLIVTKHIRRLQLHTKVVLMATIVLIVLGTLFIFILEFNHGLGNLSIKDKLLASYFQSVSTRTAGFNTIDLSNLYPTTYAIFIALMFIGAAPISSGGGIKVTTFILVLVFLWQNIRNYEHPQIFKRSIQFSQIAKALTILMMSFAFVLIMSLILSMVQPDMAYHKLLFEVTSAFGTVGLSTGITFDINRLSKVLLIIVMIVGKIGVLTLLGILTKKNPSKFKYAKGKVYL